MDSPRSTQRALFILLLGSLLLVALVMRPIAVALFLAAVLGGVLFPLHHWLCRKLRGKSGLAAGTVVLGVVLLILGPLVAFSTFIVKETTQAIAFVQTTLRSEGVEGLVTRLPDSLERLARSGLERITANGGGGLDAVQEQIGARGGQAAAAVGGVVAATGSFLFQAVMMLIALFFFLTQKEQILRWIDDASPLRRGQTRELMLEFRNVSVAVIRSSVLTALVQAAAATIGYFIVRVPHPLFFGGVTFFVALIPAVGAASVCLLAAALMFVTGHPISAIFLTAWGLFVVGLSDNVVKPLLIKGGGVHLHGAVVFFALLGGLAAFGTVGLLLGPLAVALFIALLRIYRRDYGDGAPPGGGRVGDEHLAEAGATPAGSDSTTSRTPIPVIGQRPQQA